MGVHQCRLSRRSRAASLPIRRIPGRTVSGIATEGVLPDVDARGLAAAGAKGVEGGGVDEGVGVGKIARRDRQHFDCAT